MNWLVWLYPAAWRKRYGEEFELVLKSRRLTLGMMADVVAGAIDAHLHPQVRESVKGEDVMSNEMIERCAAGGPKLSARDQRIAAIGMIVVSLVIAVAYVALRKLYHGIPPVEALFYSSFPAMMVIYTQMAYLRKRPLSTQFVCTGGSLGAIYLMIWGACALAVRL